MSASYRWIREADAAPIYLQFSPCPRERYRTSLDDSPEAWIAATSVTVKSAGSSPADDSGLTSTSDIACGAQTVAKPGCVKKPAFSL